MANMIPVEANTYPQTEPNAFVIDETHMVTLMKNLAAVLPAQDGEEVRCHHWNDSVAFEFRAAGYAFDVTVENALRYGMEMCQTPEGHLAVKAQMHVVMNTSACGTQSAATSRLFAIRMITVLATVEPMLAATVAGRPTYILFRTADRDLALREGQAIQKAVQAAVDARKVAQRALPLDVELPYDLPTNDSGWETMIALPANKAGTKTRTTSVRITKAAVTHNGTLVRVEAR